MVEARVQNPRSERIAAEFLYQWVPFESEVTAALQGVDLSREVP